MRDTRHRESDVPVERTAPVQRLPKPSDNPDRYRSGRSGQAQYATSSSHPPVWFIEAVPELSAAYAEWQAENEKGRELFAQISIAISAKNELLDGLHNGEAVRKRGVTAQELEDAEAAIRDAEEAVRRQGPKALAKLKAFDDMAHDPELRELRQSLGAPAALAAHERVEAAWQELQDAVQDRAYTYSAAGAPGRPWEDRFAGPLTAGKQAAERYFNTLIDGFDVRALRALADSK